MNKQELITEIAAASGVTKQVATTVFESTLAKISERLAAGEDVPIRGFGTFRVDTRSARQGKNPQTGETMQIPEKRVVKFKASSQLSEQVR